MNRYIIPENELENRNQKDQLKLHDQTYAKLSQDLQKKVSIINYDYMIHKSFCELEKFNRLPDVYGIVFLQNRHPIVKCTENLVYLKVINSPYLPQHP